MVGSLFIRVRMMKLSKLGIIFAANNPWVNLFGSPSLKTLPRFPFCFDDSVVAVFVSAEAVSILAELSDGMKFLAVGQQYLAINASNPQICLFFNSLNCLASTNFTSG